MAAGISLAAAVLITGAVAAGASAYAANQAATSQRRAADKNRRSQLDAEAGNMLRFDESRGADGHAIYPLYGGDTERDMWNEAVDMWGSTRSDRGIFDAVQNEYQPMVDGARRTGAGLFDGGTERQLLENFAPVKQARVAFKSQSAMDAFSKTMGEINAMQAGRGFAGDSTGSRMLKLKANTSTADAISGANLQNLEDERSIRDGALQMRLSNLGLPFEMAGREEDFSNLANNAYMNTFLRRMAPMNQFRIGVGSPPQIQPLTYTATPSTGQLIGQGVAQLGGTAMNYFTQQQQNQQQQAYLDQILRAQQPARWDVPQATGWEQWTG